MDKVGRLFMKIEAHVVFPDLASSLFVCERVQFLLSSLVLPESGARKWAIRLETDF